MTKEFLYNFIRRYKYGIVSTVSLRNTPESACVGFAVTADLEIIFDTVSDSRKYKNLLLNHNIAFVIGCRGEQTVQYEGVAKVPDDKELDNLLQTYFEVFPEGKVRKDKWKNIAYFCVTPKWIRYSNFNNSKYQVEVMTF
jgi:general stress protein 26